MATPQHFFAENQQSFTSLQGIATDSEKFNLYGGLYELAKQIDSMSQTLRNIEARIGNVESKVR